MIQVLILSLYGEQSDLSGSGWWTVLALFSIVAGVFGLVLLPALVGRARKHPFAHNLLPLAVFWGLFAAWSGISFALDQVKWSKERASSIASGYYDPRSKLGAPKIPVKTWVAVGVAYAALLGYSFAFSRKLREASATPRDPPPSSSGSTLTGKPESRG